MCQLRHYSLLKSGMLDRVSTCIEKEERALPHKKTGNERKRTSGKLTVAECLKQPLIYMLDLPTQNEVTCSMAASSTTRRSQKDQKDVALAVQREEESEDETLGVVAFERQVRC